MAAFGELIARHETAVRATLRSLCRSAPAVVDDLAQETFLRALSRLSQAQDVSRFRSWLTSIAYREFLMWRRSHLRYNEVLAEVAQEAEPMVDPDPSVARLQRYLSVLSDAEREAIVLNHGTGMSQQEVAQAMEMPLGTVKSLIARGKRRIQTQFADQAAAVKHG